MSYSLGFCSSFSFRGHITSSFVILTIIEIITNSCWRKSSNEWLPEKKALDVLRSLGSPGKRIPGLWRIELQTCQSDNINGLWLVCWNVQLSFTCSWTISPCCKDSFLTERLRLYVYTPVLPLKLGNRQMCGLSSHKWQCWKQDTRIKTWLLVKNTCNRWFSPAVADSCLPLRHIQASCLSMFSF